MQSTAKSLAVQNAGSHQNRVGGRITKLSLFWVTVYKTNRTYSSRYKTRPPPSSSKDAADGHAIVTAAWRKQRSLSLSLSLSLKAATTNDHRNYLAPQHTNTTTPWSPLLDSAAAAAAAAITYCPASDNASQHHSAWSRRAFILADCAAKWAIQQARSAAHDNKWVNAYHACNQSI